MSTHIGSKHVTNLVYNLGRMQIRFEKPTKCGFKQRIIYVGGACHNQQSATTAAQEEAEQMECMLIPRYMN